MKGEHEMEPKIISRDSFVCMGTLTRVTPEGQNSETYGLIWKTFESYHGEIKPHSADEAYYGVSFATDQEGVVDYFACMAVEGVAAAPKGLVIRELPAARYAVFECPLQAIGETYRHIFGEWLAQSPYEISAAAPAFERYPPEGKEDAPVRIHIPIRERRGPST